MNDYLWDLVQKYKRKGVFIDTELLLLYFVGTLDLNLIENFGRTSKFNKEDFSIVSTFIELFEIKITSPHILTEVSNFFGNKKELHYFLREYLELTEEKHLKSIEISKNEIFVDFGLADTAMAEISKDSYLIFTNNNPLFGYLINKGTDVVSLSQLKNFRL
ncbi:hypothetical protein BH24ACI1_BH24ACI1_15700 [soil metagenome]|jgi:hypothetical protein